MGMFSGSGGDTSTKTKPLGFVQDDLKFITNQAQNLYRKDKGFNAWGSKPGQELTTDFSSQTTDALGQIQSLASQPNPFYAGTSNFINSLVTGGRNLDTSGLQSMVGKDAITVNPQLQGLISQDANGVDQYGRPIASGANKINTEGDFRSLYDAQDADFNHVVDQTAGDLTDQITRTFGGSSYGSPEHTGTITNQVGDAIARMRSQNFQQNQANKMGILGNISGVQGQNIGNQLNAAGMLSGEQLGNRGQKAGILGQIGGFEMGNAEFQRGLQNDITGWSNQDIQNSLAGVDRADQVYNSQYLPAQQLAAVGNAYDTKNQQSLDAQKDRYNTNQNADWNRLMSYFGMASGTGAQGSQTTTSQESDPWSTIAGTATLAAQAAPYIMSDERIKDDITRVGKTDEGLGVYTYRWKGTEGPYMMGVMAQEVEQVKPEAVGKIGVGEYLGVDYSQIR